MSLELSVVAFLLVYPKDLYGVKWAAWACEKIVVSKTVFIVITLEGE